MINNYFKIITQALEYFESIEIATYFVVKFNKSYLIIAFKYMAP